MDRNTVRDTGVMPPSVEPSPLDRLTVKQVAQLLGVSPQAVNDAHRRGRLHHCEVYNVGRGKNRYFFTRADVDAYRRSRYSAARGQVSQTAVFLRALEVQAERELSAEGYAESPRMIELVNGRVSDWIESARKALNEGEE